MERKLASIQVISDIQPIIGAENIDVATVLGWKVVVRKNEFKVGDKCVYCEVDSILPDKPWSDFLRTKNFRIKTVKLRGQVSQGICFPLLILCDDIQVALEGADVTDFLGVTKYEAPISIELRGLVIGQRPSYVPKTDEIRIQSVPTLLEEMKGEICCITEKVDGTSVSIFKRSLVSTPVFGVSSRKLNLKETSENVYWRVVRELGIEEKLARESFDNIVLQGELVGPGIQRNKLGLKKLTILFFDVYLIEKCKYADRDLFFSIMDSLRLETVPIIERAIPFLYDSVDSLVDFAIRKSIISKDRLAEGIVIRSVLEKTSQVLNGRMSFKVVNPEYLLKGE